MELNTDILPEVTEWDSDNPSHPSGAVVMYQGSPHQVADFTKMEKGFLLCGLESYDKKMIDVVNGLFVEHKIEDGDVVFVNSKEEVTPHQFASLRSSLRRHGHQKTLIIVLPEGWDLDVHQRKRAKKHFEEMIQQLDEKDKEGDDETKSG